MKSKKTIGLILAAAALLLMLAVFGPWLTVRGRAGRYMLDADGVNRIESTEVPPYSMIAVLGCGVYADGSLSPLLRYRMEKTLELYLAGAAERICVTGDHREGEYDEVDHMAAYLIERGVPSDRILRDYEGFSTYESMSHLQGLAGKERVLVVTQEYHLYRALYIARTLGVDADGTAAQDWPFSSGTVMRHLREIPACIKDWLQCRGIRISGV